MVENIVLVIEGAYADKFEKRRIAQPLFMIKDISTARVNLYWQTNKNATKLLRITCQISMILMREHITSVVEVDVAPQTLQLAQVTVS